ncbi:MAG: FecR domain-containing protein [Candidatus Sericytochromatia bacterium]|nr:FecR domain-containing protein [Candidatus Sericytochromatia bacterium]
MRRWLAGVLSGFLIVGLAPTVTAADGRRASLTRADAGTLVRPGGRGTWKAARVGMLLATGDEVRTGRGALAELTYGDGTITRLGPNSTLGLKDTQVRGLRLWAGRLWMKVAKGSGGMRIQTPAAVAAVTGTDLFVFHEGNGSQQSAVQRVASAGSFRIAADSNVSTIGLLEGGVRVQKMNETFDTSMLNRSAKGVWVASTGLDGLMLAQDVGGQDLAVGMKAVADPMQPTLQIQQMSPAEIANNTSVIQNVGITNGSNTSNNNGNNKSNDKKPDEKKPDEKPNGANGKPADGKPGDGKPATNNGGNNNGGNLNTPPPPNGTDNRPGTPVNRPAGPDSKPDGPPTPDGRPNIPNTPPVPPIQPPTPPIPNVPDPTRNTVDQLIRPVDRSPSSGELEIIIQ